MPETIAGPPFRYGANPDTLLDITDLVFIDAPTTGLSRELGKAETKDFFGVDKDLDAFTRTIQRYLTKYGRWNSPKFIIGESYGTTRAAGLSKSLLDNGVQLNGIVFVSTVFNFADFQGDQSLINFLPTYAADAWYHGKIPHKPPLDELPPAGARLSPAGPMPLALQKGNAHQRRGEAVGRAADGAADRPFARLHPPLQPARAARTASGASCCATATRSSAGSIRAIVGTEPDAVGEGADYDPQGSAITGAFVGALNDYLFRDLGYKTPLTYRPEQLCRDSASDWNFPHKSPDGQQQIADTSVDLADAMRAEPAA